MPRFRRVSFRRSALVLLWFLVSTASILSAESQSPPDSPLDPLRSLDRQIERWAWQLATPDAVKPDVADLEAIRDRLRRLAAGEGEAARKASILLRRVRDLHLSATSGRALAEYTLASTVAPRSLVPSEKAAGCSGAGKLPVGEWVVDPASTAEGLWLAFTAPEAGSWIIHTVGSRADTKLERWCDCSASEPSEVNDDGVGLRSRLVFEADAGETIRLRLESTADDRVLVFAGRAGTGSISGRVVEAASGEPIQSLDVEVYRSTGSVSGSYHGRRSTNSEGVWRMDGLEPGTYFARTASANDSVYIDQVYDGFECSVGQECVPIAGRQIEVDGPVSGIDFALRKGATVSGRVSQSRTGLRIEEALVEARSPVEYRYDWTDASGRYEITGLGGSEIRLVASSDQHQGEAWPDSPCENAGCDEAGVPISIGPDQEIVGLDFELQGLASLSGRVTAAATGWPIEEVQVRIYEASTGAYRGKAVTDGAGLYTIGGIEAGEYRVRIADPAWVAVNWPDEACICECTTKWGDVVTISPGENREGIDFSLSRYGAIEGHVLEASTGSPTVDSATITIHDESGKLFALEYSSFLGSYEISMAPPGRVYAVATSSRHQDEVWDDTACSSAQICDPLAGDAIVVESETVVTGIDFALDRYRNLRGRVTWEATGEPAQGVEVVAFGSSGGFDPRVSTDSSGEYEFQGLAPGTYFLKARSPEALDELYPDIPCEGPSACDPETGTGVAMDLGSDTSGIDFVLRRLPLIRGTVRDVDNGEALPGIEVEAYDEEGNLVVSVESAEDGTFELTALSSGTYYLAATSPGDHLDHVIGAGDCSRRIGDCAPEAGTPILVGGPGTERVQDIELRRGAVLEGEIRGPMIETQLHRARIHVYDAEGRYWGYEETRTPEWRFGGLYAGEYRIQFESRGYPTLWWPDCLDVAGPFEPCDLSSVETISVALGETRSSLDFAVDRLGTLSGLVVDSMTGEALEESVVHIYNSGGYTEATRATDNGRFVFYDLEPQPYYVAVQYADRHLEQVYGGDMCAPGCDPLSGDSVMVPLASEVRVTIPLDPGPGISGRVVDALTGAPLPGVGLDLWYEVGVLGLSASSAPDGTFQLLSNLGGTFYLSTDTGSEYGDIVWEGVDCPDGPAFEGACDPTTGTPIVLGDHQPLVPIEIRLEGGTSPMIFRDGFESGTMSAWSTSR